MGMSYMSARCGSWQVGDDPDGGLVEFRVFYPDVVPGQTSEFDPHVTAIRVKGEFLALLGLREPEASHGLAMTPEASTDPKGTFWSVITPTPLPSGFYEYWFDVTFDDGTGPRQVADPCARYSGLGGQAGGPGAQASGPGAQASAFVVGGSRPADNVVRPVAGGRTPLVGLNVYELMIDDFTSDYRGTKAPLAAVEDKLDEIRGMGFTAIQFMPWTAWAHHDFDWGYAPWGYFAVESRYANQLGQPAEKLSLLKHLISACHDRGIHVIMDGVYNHAGPDFPYPKLYRDATSCPFTNRPFLGTFATLLDLNFANSCTRDFVDDVVRYWTQQFGIDGIRFDNTTNFYAPGQDAPGLAHLLSTTASETDAPASNFSLTIEHLDISAAAITASTAATSYWDNSLYEQTFASLWDRQVRPELLGALNPRRSLLNGPPGKVPTLYLSNHDHSTVTARAGERDNPNGRENLGTLNAWWRIQPYLIGLFTSTGVPLVPNGQEFAEDYLLPENDHGTGRRVVSRPLRWKHRNDEVGRTLVGLHTRLARMRSDHPALRSEFMYPGEWATWQTRFAPTGVGLDTHDQVAAYHRWDELPTQPGDAHTFENIVVVLNFTDESRIVDVGFPFGGTWRDLLSEGNDGRTVQVDGGRARVAVDSNYGVVLHALNHVTR